MQDYQETGFEMAARQFEQAARDQTGRKADMIYDLLMIEQIAEKKGSIQQLPVLNQTNAVAEHAQVNPRGVISILGNAKPQSRKSGASIEACRADEHHVPSNCRGNYTPQKSVGHSRTGKEIRSALEITRAQTNTHATLRTRVQQLINKMIRSSVPYLLKIENHRCPCLCPHQKLC